MHPKRLVQRCIDFCLNTCSTLACWSYFTLGFVIFFSPFYVGAYVFASDRRRAFQLLNKRFYQGFLRILSLSAPRQQWLIDPRIREIRSAIVVCNHLSYLDPLILIAHLERSLTVVKAIFFTLPIFGWVIRNAGYLPSSAEGPFAGLMLRQIESFKSQLAQGAALFVFPEGTRSRDGAPGPLNPGAMKLARHCQAPIYVLRLSNTQQLFPPGRFLFQTRRPNCISLILLGRIEAHQQALGMNELNQQIREFFLLPSPCPQTIIAPAPSDPITPLGDEQI